MVIRIVYRGIPYYRVKRRSKRYFSGTEYICRNGVYTYPDSSVTYAVRRDVVDIVASGMDAETFAAVRGFVIDVFNNTRVGIHAENADVRAQLPALRSAGCILI